MDDYPGTKEDARIGRLRLTRDILARAHRGERRADLIIQPQLLVPTRPGPRPFFFIAPDILVWSPDNEVYLPGDLKSFIVRENEVAKGDLARVRLQLGAQALGLMHEYERIDSTVIVPARGMLVFSRPNGLRPHEPRVEDIGGAVEAIRIGIAAFLRHRARIDALRAGAEPFTVAAELAPNFQDGCLASCVMAQWCRQRVAGQAGDMGEIAAEVLGGISIDRALELLTGVAEPTTERERILAERLRELAIQHEADAAA